MKSSLPGKCPVNHSKTIHMRDKTIVFGVAWLRLLSGKGFFIGRQELAAFTVSQQDGTWHPIEDQVFLHVAMWGRFALVSLPPRSVGRAVQFFVPWTLVYGYHENPSSKIVWTVTLPVGRCLSKRSCKRPWSHLWRLDGSTFVAPKHILHTPPKPI